MQLRFCGGWVTRNNLFKPTLFKSTLKDCENFLPNLQYLASTTGEPLDPNLQEAA